MLNILTDTTCDVCDTGGVGVVGLRVFYHDAFWSDVGNNSLHHVSMLLWIHHSKSSREVIDVAPQQITGTHVACYFTRAAFREQLC